LGKFDTNYIFYRFSFFKENKESDEIFGNIYHLSKWNVTVQTADIQNTQSEFTQGNALGKPKNSLAQDMPSPGLFIQF
jgi:hypothetical protein